MNKTATLGLGTQQKDKTLREFVKETVERYLDSLGGSMPANLYQLVLEEVELPLLESTMQYTKQNQVRSAKALGIARGTLRTKLKKYGMLDSKSRD
ncbi:DNA-binding transcriptional regulator Fis [soil metagenome]